MISYAGGLSLTRVAMDAFPSTSAVACGAIENVFVHHENDSLAQSIAG